MNEYPKISDHEPGSHGKASFARIDFSDRSFTHFIREDDEDEQPRFFSVGRDENNDRTSVSFEGLTNNVLREFAHEILRQFPAEAVVTEPTYTVAIDNDGDEWMQLYNDAYTYVFSTRAEAARQVNPRVYGLRKLATECGIKTIRTVTGEEEL